MFNQFPAFTIILSTGDSKHSQLENTGSSPLVFVNPRKVFLNLRLINTSLFFPFLSSKFSESFVLRRQTKKFFNSPGMFWIWREPHQSVQFKIRTWEYHTISGCLSSHLKTIKSTLIPSRAMLSRLSLRNTIWSLSGNMKTSPGETVKMTIIENKRTKMAIITMLWSL